MRFAIEAVVDLVAIGMFCTVVYLGGALFAGAL